MRRLTVPTALSALTAVLLVACSTGSPTPTGGSPAAAAAASASVGADNVFLYDDSRVHDIDVSFDKAAYDAMVAAYASNRDKDWIEATVTIDGVTVERVGMRLKGNSSLRGVSTSGTTQPESLPWLIRFDKYVDGQTYQGHTDIVIRGNSSKTSMNEAVALELIGLAGEATQESIATRFSINGSAEVLRLAIELPNDDWDDANFDTDGVLYKAESTGDYSYRGENPDAYDEVFDQESDTEDENLAPLIGFLEFVNTSSDAAFATDLSKHLDVDAFARYLALQELVNNFDDIDGPGNNSYLRYDESTKKFTVLSWDMNLAFGSLPGANMGGGGGGGPRAGTPPAGGVAAGGPGAQPPAAGAGAAPRGGPGGRSNILVQRFQANATFAELVAKAKTDLRAQLFASGKGIQVVDRWAALLTAQSTDLVDAATIEREAAVIRAQVE